MNRPKKIFLWIFWFIVVPAGHWFAFKLSPPQALGIWDVAAYTAIIMIVASLPLTVNGTAMFLTQWITIAAFLSHGLFFEMLLLQVATVTAALAANLKYQQPYRFLLFSSMFSLISLISGLGFFAFGGKIGQTTVESIVFPGTIFILLNFITAMILQPAAAIFLGNRKKFFGRGLAWNAGIRIVIYPLGIALFHLKGLLGPIAFLLIGIPFIGLLIILKMNRYSQNINRHLQKAVAIGHQLTERLDEENILHLFINKITKTLPADWVYIFRLEGDELVVISHLEQEEKAPLEPDYTMSKEKGISGYVLKNKKGVIFNEKSEWKKFSYGYSPENAESIMCVPIMRGKHVEGVLFLASANEKVYKKYQLMIVDILCSYLAVALSNARHYEETKRKSEICTMTNIPNYRFFDQHLNERMADLETGKLVKLSLIMIDIDHFKNINDTYGHQSGDLALCQLASLLKSTVAEKGLVARYGGEEFVVLLPDTEQAAARHLAETLRKKIEDHIFFVQDVLGDSEAPKEIRLTASIGVATAPDQARDAVSLIKYADRALYIGAKRAGRNKVAEYIHTM
ncbi:sensor domain-containing diguanylate cyclase [Siminovitchia fortis]|nr:sensor domain-containing diguanylate cyclase [Siminovitchia fortis]WHY82497.1 sensor domain-containing diguanylate cyclase [Siminovitchia fortis]